jgi:hypothetical protein
MDSQASGVARAFCCLNARAVDYLRFDYAWQWRRMPTLPTLPASTADRAGTFTPAERPPGDDFFAEGLRGQLLYIAPATQAVILRLGRDWGAVNWPEWMSLLAHLNP